MIVVKLFGGLGNQMFQYSLGRHLSFIHKTSLMLDTCYFKEDKLRKYSLDPFKIRAVKDFDNELRFYRKTYLVRFNNILSKALPFLFKYKIIYENNLFYDPNILSFPDNIYLIGYWQSEKYFSNIRNIIKDDFTLKIKTRHLNRLLDLINRCNSVSIHIRRGDFVNNKDTNKYHGICDLGYYHSAVNIISKKLCNVSYFVFSDDIAWAKENLKLKGRVTFIDKKYKLEDFEQMMAMSCCKHNIIANSSFSWWGAWLNQYKNKIVISPKKWLNDKHFNTKDLIPENWIKI